VAKDINSGSDEVLESFNMPLHRIEVRDQALCLSRKFPPKKLRINYNDIASVEHNRLIDYHGLVNPIFALAIFYLVNFVGIVENIISQLILEINHAAGSTASSTLTPVIRSQAEQAITVISAILVVVIGYYLIQFVFSLRQRFVIYRSGKAPIAIPLPLTGDSLAVMKKLNDKVKETKGISKQEAEKIVGEQIRGMLDRRQKMQEDLMGSVKEIAKAAKTKDEKEKAKRMLDETIAKIEAQDEAIDRELKKTGLNKDEVFKKYHIKAPQKEFIDSILEGEGVDLPKKDTDDDEKQG
jgi:hypothetical protein